MILDPIETLAQLISIPSINPMGREFADPTFGEARLTDHLEETFGKLGLTTHRQAVAPGRDNLIARLDGHSAAGAGPIVLLDVHQDTVPADGMTIKPFEPRQQAGRMYGRGACDVKGGMAAIIAAVSRLVEECPTRRPTIIVSCTVNEEYGFTGASRITELWSGGGIFPRRPDTVIVAEPTGLDVVVAHKGVVRWKCHTSGRAAHSSRPEMGDNAIYAMARVLTPIQQYAAELAEHGPVHRLCGLPTLSVGTIRGGLSVNTVPDRCTIEIDCRLPPGYKPEMAHQGLIDYLSRAVGTRLVVEVETPYMSGPPLSDEHNKMLANQLSRVVHEVAGTCRQLGVPYSTNAGLFAEAGATTVIFGPGFAAQAHTADEWISLDQLQQATEIIYRFCLSATG
jgi:acetylornithine deacetylase ArgE